MIDYNNCPPPEPYKKADGKILTKEELVHNFENDYLK